MKIKDILKIQKVIDQRENPYDVLENIDTMSYFSKSKNTKIKIKDMSDKEFKDHLIGLNWEIDE